MKLLTMNSVFAATGNIEMENSEVVCGSLKYARWFYLY